MANELGKIKNGKTDLKQLTSFKDPDTRNIYAHGGLEANITSLENNKDGEKILRYLISIDELANHLLSLKIE